MFNFWSMPQQTVDYVGDAWQRSILYADVMRQRGNQYRAHMQETAPNVLDFPATLVMRGDTLPRPVNYGLVRIQPAAGVATDPTQRPFVIVDPRAGHGPGIGGFKADSEIGAALAAGHPCYYVGFTPDPMQGPAHGMSVRPTSAGGINRIDNAPGLKSPLFTNLPTGEAVSGMQGGTVNTFSAPDRPAGADRPAVFDTLTW